LIAILKYLIKCIKPTWNRYEQKTILHTADALKLLMH